MPVSIARLRALIDLAGSEGVEGIDIVENGAHIRISRNAGAAPLRRRLTPERPEPSDTATAPDILVAPMFGVLHMTSAPGVPPYVTVGVRIARGQQLCLIEAMKMFNPVYSDRDGRLDAILAEPGGEVASGQPLFRILEA